MGCASSAADSGNTHSTVAEDISVEFADVERLVVASCTRLIAHWEKESKASWAEIQKEVISLKISDNEAQARVREALVAVQKKDAKALASVLATCRLRAGGFSASGKKAITDSGENAFAIVENTLRLPTKQVLHSMEMVSLRKELLDAVVKSDTKRIENLCSAIEALGDPCTLERALAVDLLERSTSVGSPQQSKKGHTAPYSQLETSSNSEVRSAATEGQQKQVEAHSLGIPSAEDSARLRILNLSLDTLPTERQLRSAFKRAALAWHPDRPQNRGKIDSQAANKFREAREAYDHLLTHCECGHCQV